jgi:hypothetical protein
MGIRSLAEQFEKEEAAGLFTVNTHVYRGDT